MTQHALPFPYRHWYAYAVLFLADCIELRNCSVSACTKLSLTWKWQYVFSSQVTCLILYIQTLYGQTFRLFLSLYNRMCLSVGSILTTEATKFKGMCFGNSDNAINLPSQVPVTTVYPVLCQSELHSGRKELTSNCINPGPQSTDFLGSLDLSKHAIFCLLLLWWESSSSQTELRVGTQVLGHHKCKAPERLAACPQHICIPHAREGVRKATDIGSSLVF